MAYPPLAALRATRVDWTARIGPLPNHLVDAFRRTGTPIAHVLISLLGLFLAVAGWTLPYSSVFTRADQLGQLKG